MSQFSLPYSSSELDRFWWNFVSILSRSDNRPTSFFYFVFKKKWQNNVWGSASNIRYIKYYKAVCRVKPIREVDKLECRNNRNFFFCLLSFRAWIAKSISKNVSTEMRLWRRLYALKEVGENSSKSIRQFKHKSVINK